MAKDLTIGNTFFTFGIMKAKIHISIDEKLLKAAEKQAVEESRTRSSFIENCVRHYLTRVVYVTSTGIKSYTVQGINNPGIHIISPDDLKEE